MKSLITRSVAVLGAVGSLGLAAACGTPEPTSESTVEQAVSVPVDPPRVQLITPGAAPLQVLSYHDSGAVQDQRVELSDGFDSSTGTKSSIDAAPEANPHVETLSARVHATAAGADSRAVKVQFADPTYTDPARAEDATGINGFELGWDADATGRATSVNLAAPKNTSDNSRALAELYVMKLLAQPIIFPSGPVGIGAEWTVENRVAGDSTMLRTSKYTLDRVAGDRLTIRTEVSERPAVSAIPMQQASPAGADGTPAGELKVLSAQSASRGMLEIDRTKPLPVGGDVSLSTRVRYGQDSSETAVAQDFVSQIRFR